MRGISELRLGRSLQTRAKRHKIRKRKPRFANLPLKSDYRAKPKVMKPRQPYLSTDTDITKLI
jgi:hypothetical protein